MGNDSQQVDQRVPTPKRLADALRTANAPAAIIRAAEEGAYYELSPTAYQPIDHYLVEAVRERKAPTSIIECAEKMAAKQKVYLHPIGGLRSHCFCLGLDAIAARAAQGEFAAQDWELKDWARKRDDLPDFLLDRLVAYMSLQK